MRPEISGEQAQNNLAFYKFLESEIAFKLLSLILNGYKQNVNSKFGIMLITLNQIELCAIK